MYTLYIGGNQLVNFANIVDFNSTYAIETGITLMMKKMSTECVTQFAKIVGNYAFVPIKNILTKEVESYPVYNFSVEEEESYVANGIAVHNCTAPIYTSNSLHAAVVEVVAHKNSHIRYITIQNWAKNIYNLTTQRAYVEENAHMEWIDTNIGSKVNMKYPSVYLRGRHAKGEILSIALASEGQNQDSGGKAYHLAPDTVSRIVSKSISKGTGLATFRSLIHIGNKAENSKSNTICNALLMDDKARTNTFPYVDVQRNDSMVSHEAKVGKISEEEVFYLMSRGISESDAIAMIILGFLKDFKEAVPLEYSLELKRLIKLNMAGSVG
jgi:Fe-S cluster assembly protein SufB